MTYKRASTKYELVYQTGGTGGPYHSEEEAKEAAERLMKGGSDRWIAVIDAAQLTDLKKAKALWTLKRGKDWDKGPNPLPNVNPMEHHKSASSESYTKRITDVKRKFVEEAAVLIKQGIERHGGTIRQFHVNKRIGNSSVEFEGTNFNDETVFIILELGSSRGTSTLELSTFMDYGTAGVAGNKPSPGWGTIKSHVSITPEDFALEFWKIYENT
jgi:hypothetical protein